MSDDYYSRVMRQDREERDRRLGDFRGKVSYLDVLDSMERV